MTEQRARNNWVILKHLWPMNVTVFSGEFLCKSVRWVKIRKTCLLYTWALSLKIANHKSRNLWKLHVKLPFQIAKMKFTWNSLHENFTWYYHVTIFRQRFTWNSRENFTWMSHAVMLHVYIISNDYKRHRFYKKFTLYDYEKKTTVLCLFLTKRISDNS